MILYQPTLFAKRYQKLLRAADDRTGLSCAAVLPLLAISSVREPLAWAIVRCSISALAMALGISPLAIACCSGSFALALGSWTAAGTALIHPVVVRALLMGCSGSFTFGEAVLVSNFAMALLITIADNSEFGLTGSALFGALTFGCMALPAALRFDHRWTGWASIYAIALSVVATYVHAWVIGLRGLEPLRYVAEYILRSKTRLGLTVYWIGMLAATIGVFPPHAWKTSKTIARKGYHALAMLLFCPALMLDREFLSFALAVALCLMLTVECVRVSSLSARISTAIDSYTSKLLDSRDDGRITLTHMYLLVGMAFPIWLDTYNARVGDTPLFQHAALHPQVASLAQPKLLVWSGIVASGVLDSTASVVGSSLGRIRWPGSRKTIEGSLAASVCCFVFLAGVYLVDEFNWLGSSTLAEGPAGIAKQLSKIGGVAIFAAMVEATTSQIDNLVLPLASFLILLLLGIA